MHFTDPWSVLLTESSLFLGFMILCLVIRKSAGPLSPKKGKALLSNKKNLESNIEKIDQLLKDSQTLSLDLSQNLEEKREIVKKLVETLEERIQTLHHLVGKIEGKLPALLAGATQEADGRVLEMALAGGEVSEIARRLGISKEEVQLILDLKKITPLN